MRMTVLGGGGAWPTPQRGCSGYLIEQDGFLLLVDPGYATLPELLTRVAARAVDAVFVTHSHPDHCADLNPLLRARHLSENPPPALPVFAPPDAADAVLALDGQMLAGTYSLREFGAGDGFTIGPFQLSTRSLSHFVPNVGVRITAGDAAIAYTGDGGADPAVVELADGARLLLAEATFVDKVPPASRGLLADAAAAEHAARTTFDGPVSVALPGLSIDLGE